jgi:hypothetical protein
MLFNFHIILCYLDYEITFAFILTAFFVLTLGSRYFSTRQMIISGGFIAALGFFLNAYAPTIAFLFFSQGILYGRSFVIYLTEFYTTCL